MKTPLCRRPAWAVCLLTLCTLAAAAPAGAAERGPVRKASAAASVETEGRVIVKFKADSSLMRALAAGGAGAAAPQHAQALSARLGLSLTDGRAIGARVQVLKARGLSSRELADRLAAQSDVEYAVVDGRARALAVPNDPLYPTGQTTVTPAAGQWYLRAPTSSTIVDPTSIVASINAPAAWDFTTGSASVVVAVLDTGVRFDHPDLTSKLLPGYDFIHDAATANDGDVRDNNAGDPGDGVTSADVNVVAGCSSTDVAPSSWHGTQTAGLIGAATNNGAGMAGAGWNVMLLPVRVLGKCGGYDSDIQAAMLWSAGIAVSGVPANTTPAKVINMSLGATGACSAAYADAVQQINARGAVVVAAAGNDGLAVGTPANCAGVIAVAGVRHAGTKVGYSDLGPQVAISAPAGNCVNTTGPCLFPLLTTSNSGAQGPVAGAAGAIYTDGNNNASLGTSFSAPLVAGTVGLMLSANPGLSPAQVLAALKSTARPFPSTGAGTGVSACTAPTATAQGDECYCTTSTCGAGLLDAGAAVAAVAGITANITVASTSVTAGSSVTLDGSLSHPSTANDSIVSYAWSITDGTSIATLTSAANASSVTLLTSAAGTVVVSLTVVDSAGQQATNTATLTVSATGSGGPPGSGSPPPTSSGGGGGAMELGWLLGWLASVIGVRVVTPRQRRGA
jgi:serine protease